MQMTKKSNLLVLVLLLVASSFVVAEAKNFKDEGLADGEVITLDAIMSETEIHMDATITNEFPIDVAGPSQNHRGIFDYRLEAHTPLYNLNSNQGRIITRVEGFGFLDENIDNFFDDALIDIPELLYENDTDLTGDGKNILTTTFGKFANRRYLDKDELSPDSFDMGERPFFGAIANTNNLLNSINENRDTEHAAAGTRLATGSYGFAFNFKNYDKEGDFLTSRWGFRQILAVSQLDDFGDNFYGATEVNKSWGDKNAGKSSLGMIYANKGVFRTPGSQDNDYLVYTSLVQKMGRFTPYLRWGTLFTDDSGQDLSKQEFRTGLIYKLTDNDLITTHLVYLDTKNGYGPDHGMIWINFWRHRFHDNLIGWVYVVPKYELPNTASPDGDDNNMTIGFELQALI